MPISGARYRFRKTKKGEQRLAFKGSKVVEVVNYMKSHGKMMKGKTEMIGKK